jgi:GalNAc-alpha-(1->4)-GalNAc-alpha-(1->3)-diNAcBac-PP-undecaprenol alpha-1,4-N-acetyl-D-galactosaminyltransferase
MVSGSHQEIFMPPSARSQVSKGRLTFIIYKLSAGGAQRVLTVLANELCKRGWSLTLLTFDDGSEPPFFKLHPDIQYQPLALMREQGSRWKSFKINILRPLFLRKAIRESNPQAVITFIDLTNILTLIAMLGLKIPVIVSERVHPAFSQMGKHWFLIRKWVYRLSVGLVLQTQDMAGYFSTAMQKKIRVVPNPISVPHNDVTLEAETHGKTLLAIGRLCEQKGFDLLLEAFAPLCDKHPEWVLEIWGEGEQKDFLQARCDELGLQKRVVFPGLAKEPYNILSKASIFVLPSRFEGFPNVLGEAMACGLPVVSFDCPSGPSEMIRDGVDGLLITSENIQALSNALERLMTSPELRESLGEQARNITERFSLDKVVQTWEDLIVEVINEPQI